MDYRSIIKSAGGLSLVGIMILVYLSGHYPWQAMDVPVMQLMCPSPHSLWAPPTPTSSSLALIESDGFLDDVSDADWRRMKSRFQETPDCHHECEPSPAKVLCPSARLTASDCLPIYMSAYPSLSPLSLSHSVSHGVYLSASVFVYLTLSLCLSLSLCLDSLSHSVSHTLLITCTCCYDQIKGTQHKDFSYSFFDSLSLCLPLGVVSDELRTNLYLHPRAACRWPRRWPQVAV